MIQFKAYLYIFLKEIFTLFIVIESVGRGFLSFLCVCGGVGGVHWNLQTD